MSEIIENHFCVCGECRLNLSDSKLVATGKKTEFILLNNANKIIDKYIVDDCLLRLRKQEEKCDYLFIVKEVLKAYFIECKGSDILKAVGQLNSTINILGNELLEYTIKARIIPTKVFSPDMRTNIYKKLRARLNGHLETKNIVCTEII